MPMDGSMQQALRDLNLQLLIEVLNLKKSGKIDRVDEFGHALCERMLIIAVHHQLTYQLGICCRHLH